MEGIGYIAIPASIMGETAGLELIIA